MAVVLFSGFEISKSEKNTTLAKKTRVIKITKRLIFFMVSRFDRFERSNFENIYRLTKENQKKSLKIVIKLHLIDYFELNCLKL